MECCIIYNLICLKKSVMLQCAYKGLTGEAWWWWWFVWSQQCVYVAVCSMNWMRWDKGRLGLLF